jgi:uncharacterized protein involved in exopolysaccharide biosynthesis
VDIRDYVKAVHDGIWTIIATVVLSTVAALGISLLLSPTYQGEATMLLSHGVSQTSPLGGLLGNIPQRAFSSQLELMRTRPVAELALRESGLPYTSSYLLDHFSIDPSSLTNQSDLVTIHVSDGNPERAVVLTNAIARAYVEWSRETRKTRLSQGVEKIQKLVDDAHVQVSQLEKRAKKPRKKDESSVDLPVAIERYSRLSVQLDTLRGNEQIEDGGVLLVSPAVVGEKVSPKPLANGLFGFVLGLVLGLTMVFIGPAMKGLAS